MNLELREMVDLMVSNYHQCKKPFLWEAGILKHFSALVYAEKQRKIDIGKIEEIRKYIKNKTGVFSYFRGSNEFILANLMGFEEDYKSFFDSLKECYQKIGDAGFKRSDYLPFAAYTLVKYVDRDQWDYKIKRMVRIYNDMKKNHYFLTSDDDYVFVAVLAVSDMGIDETSKKIEMCYDVLRKEGFHRGNELQTLSHIISVGEEDIQSKCRRAGRLYNKINSQVAKVSYRYLATLGLLTLICIDEDKMVRELKEVYNYIYTKDGYGFWSMDKGTRLMMAATIISAKYVDELKNGLSKIVFGNSIKSILIAQQQAAVAVCVASAAAASTSNT